MAEHWPSLLNSGSEWIAVLAWLKKMRVMQISERPHAASHWFPEAGVTEHCCVASVELPLLKRLCEFHVRRTKYAVVIPVWNQGATIGAQLERMAYANCPGDIVLVDGDSSDGSTESALLERQGVRSLLVTQEPGLGNALKLGIFYALSQDYSGVITLDGNGKDGVESIKDFARALDEGCDLVQGSRFVRHGVSRNTPWERYVGIRLLIAPLISFRCGFWYTDPTNGFKGLSRRLLMDDRMCLFRRELSSFSFQFYLNYRAARLHHCIKEIPVSRVYPSDGTVPTKIVGLRSRARLLSDLFKTILGRYDP